MGFFKPLIVQEERDKENVWIVYEDFSYDIGGVGGDDTITVPKGYETDFASIPRGLWWLLPPSGKYRGAAVIHDYLYQNRGKYHPTKPALTRPQSDNVFLEAMKELGVSLFTRRTMWAAVRGFGWMRYPKK